MMSDSTCSDTGFCEGFGSNDAMPACMLVFSSNDNLDGAATGTKATELALADWHWLPGGLARAGFAYIFSPHWESAWREGGVFKAGASELLQAYPFPQWSVVEHVPSHKIRLQRSSFLNLCRVMDLISEAKNGSNPKAMRDQLIQAAGEHQRSHQLS